MSKTSAATRKTRSQSIASVEKRYEKYLVEERGLSSGTVHTYWWYVRGFLRHCGDGKDVTVSAIRRPQIDTYVRATARRISTRGVQVTTSSIRSFLRFAFLHNLMPIDLSTAVMSARSWRQAQLPRYLPAPSVERVIDSCDRTKAQGRKERAILLLMARLGLRAKEIHQVKLEDFNWSSGELLVRGKGKVNDWLPLSHEVGEAVAAHLKDRPRSSFRHLFITPKESGQKPYLNSTFVNHALHRALKRAGIDNPTPWVGSHLLRHSLATTMLHRGASMEEIGGVLRHRWAHTTSIYAKVDVEALRSIARPWPIEVRS
ncbi:MAG: putative integrase/recombinase [Myxococcaceae bacterium]|nr:putative integrase/recombinase [Myxococcaceae bacterium]